MRENECKNELRETEMSGGSTQIMDWLTVGITGRRIN